MALDYLLDDCQASSNSAAEFLALVQPPEDAEDRIVMALRNPYAVIADVKDRGVGGGEGGEGEKETRFCLFPLLVPLLPHLPVPTPHSPPPTPYSPLHLPIRSRPTSE